MESATRQLPGASNFEMTYRFLENFWTPGFIILIEMCACLYNNTCICFFHSITHCSDPVFLICPKTTYLILKILEVQVEWDTKLS